jgi:hypothetical protein
MDSCYLVDCAGKINWFSATNFDWFAAGSFAVKIDTLERILDTCRHCPIILGLTGLKVVSCGRLCLR